MRNIIGSDLSLLKRRGKTLGRREHGVGPWLGWGGAQACEHILNGDMASLHQV